MSYDIIILNTALEEQVGIESTLAGDSIILDSFVVADYAYQLVNSATDGVTLVRFHRTNYTIDYYNLSAISIEYNQASKFFLQKVIDNGATSYYAYICTVAGAIWRIDLAGFDSTITPEQMKNESTNQVGDDITIESSFTGSTNQVLKCSGFGDDCTGDIRQEIV